ncbi:hypothetical protein [Citricoccus sp. GCM10030269]|uniref:hypothetical protein n=1 Tax=Citricoccus sp. GCM10030269 TaxID=3273388 RepID=UPI00361CD987
MRTADGSEPTHWLLPINPAAHAEHQPADWRERYDATGVWKAIGQSQPIDRWCLNSGFRTMRPGDVIWAYLSQRQDICAVGVVRNIAHEDGWIVYLDWDSERTAHLCRDPLPRRAFGQVPMSTCRADARAAAVLSQWYEETGTLWEAPK